MYQGLKQHNLILVTGPQRAGTTIAAKIIAHDTGHQYIDERDFEAVNKEQWWLIVNSAEKAVIHCPGMCRWVAEAGRRDDVLVVLVKRPIDDIIASQERIGWSHEEFELSNYEGFAQPGEPISAVKYRYWDEVQANKIKHSGVVFYGELKRHKLWVPKKDRADFHARQTAI